MNEYREQAQRLMNNILKVETQTFSIEDEKYERNFDVCMLNGDKYITANSVYKHFSSRIEQMIRYGLLQESDIYYFYNNSRIRMFVKVGVIAKIKYKLTKLLKDEWNNERFIVPIIDEASSVSVTYAIAPPDAISESVRAYKERKELFDKAKAYDEYLARQAEQEYNQKIAEIEREKKKEEEKTLRDLVGQIEAMGWHVTLTLKENG